MDLLIIVVILLFMIFYFKKNLWNLNGKEIYLFQLASILWFNYVYIVQYPEENLSDLFSLLAVLCISLLAIYYSVRTIKYKQYISIRLFGFYFCSSIINTFVGYFMPWTSLAVLLYPFFAFIFLSLIIVINFLLFIFNFLRNKHYKNKMDKINIRLLIIAIIIPIIFGMIFNIIHFKIIKNNKLKVIEILNNCSSLTNEEQNILLEELEVYYDSQFFSTTYYINIYTLKDDFKNLKGGLKIDITKIYNCSQLMYNNE